MYILTEVQLSRDPFARADLMRGLVAPDDRSACTWCGNRPGRFIYFWVSDGLRAAPPPHPRTPAFCSKGCRDSYNS